VNHKTFILLQTRLTSTRLPGKALLSVRSYPMFLLSFYRATKSGLPGIVVTSDHQSDDLIANVCKTQNVNFYRGHLNNVLRRFYDATINLNCEDIIVRLTADNLFPDGEFIQELLDIFSNIDVDILSTDSPKDKLPYGLSVEIFRVKSLREAFTKAHDDFDLEHVTPWMKRNKKYSSYLSNLKTDYAHLSCTVDTLEEYVNICKVMNIHNDPIKTSWKDLCETLRKLNDN